MSSWFQYNLHIEERSIVESRGARVLELMLEIELGCRLSGNRSSLSTTKFALSNLV